MARDPVNRGQPAEAGRRPLTEREVAEAELQAKRIQRAAAAQVNILAARQLVHSKRWVTAVSEGQLLQQLVHNQGLARQLREHPTPAANPPDTSKRAKKDPTKRDKDPDLDWDVSDEQIEALALKAVLEIRQLPSAEVEQAWECWRRELGLRLPPYVATEVARRAEQLWQLSE